MENIRTISDILKEENKTLFMPCGNKGICGKCKVILEGDVSPITKRERELLSEEEIKNNVRLACMSYPLSNNYKVTVLFFAETNIVTEGYMPQIITKKGKYDYSVAVDIGTTTLCASLFDSSTGKKLKTLSRLNPEISYGADVISRIDMSLNGKREELQRIIKKAVKEMTDSFNVKNFNTVITGNTAMLYIYLGMDVTSLARLPFIPKSFLGEYIDESTYIPNIVSSYIGGDILCAVLSSEMNKKEETSLLIDIGTNGEIVLKHKNKMYASSVAAGPAFEGGNLSCGMTASKGSISKVYEEDDEIKFDVIGNVSPKGICGCAIVDIVAILLKKGIIEKNGAFTTDEKEFTFKDTNVKITQKDIRTIQLSKSAVNSGILSLLKKAEIDTNEIDTLYIAGGFGYYLDKDNAEKIGLFPFGLKEKVKVMGNLALSGASMLALNEAYKKEVAEISKNITVTDLSTDPFFFEKYVENMSF